MARGRSGYQMTSQEAGKDGELEAWWGWSSLRLSACILTQKFDPGDEGDKRDERAKRANRAKKDTVERKRQRRKVGGAQEQERSQTTWKWRVRPWSHWRQLSVALLSP